MVKTEDIFFYILLVSTLTYFSATPILFEKITPYLAADGVCESCETPNVEGNLIPYVLLAGVLYLPTKNLLQKNFLEKIWGVGDKRFLLVSTVSCILLSVLVNYFILLDFPNSADEVVYLLQAQILGEGKTYLEVPQLYEEFFRVTHMGVVDGRLFGRYFMLWPAILASAEYVNLPENLVNPLLSAASIVLIYLLGTLLYNQKAAKLSVILTLLTPFYLFNSASYFPHPLALFCVLTFAYSFFMGMRKDSSLWLLIAGAALGALINIRVLTAASIGLPFMGYLIYQVSKDYSRIRGVIYVGLGSLPFILDFLWFNASITGDILVTPVSYMDPTEGFHIKDSNPLKCASLPFLWISELFFWGTPFIAFLGIWFFMKEGTRDHQMTVLALAVLLNIMLYGMYCQIGGERYGPRYLFEVIGFINILTCAGFLKYVGGVKDGHRIEAGFLATVFCFFILLTVIHGETQYKEIYARTSPFRLSEDLSNSIVFLKDGVGSMKPPQLTRNTIHLNDSILYAIYQERGNQRLMDAYPGRKYYVFSYEKEVGGEITPYLSNETRFLTVILQP